jgi:hypothetical protein
MVFTAPARRATGVKHVARLRHLELVRDRHVARDALGANQREHTPQHRGTTSIVS